MIEQIVLVVHIIVALAIVGLILLQQGKGADMGASFGGGGSQTLFGAGGGGSLLTQATAILAAIFFATSFGLAIIAKQKASIDVNEDLIAVPQVQQVEAADAVADIEARFDDLPDFDTVSPDAAASSESGFDSAADIIDSIPE